jgi:hypothetical protein
MSPRQSVGPIILKWSLNQRAEGFSDMDW